MAKERRPITECQNKTTQVCLTAMRERIGGIWRCPGCQPEYFECSPEVAEARRNPKPIEVVPTYIQQKLERAAAER